MAGEGRAEEEGGRMPKILAAAADEKMVPAILFEGFGGIILGIMSSWGWGRGGFSCVMN